MLRQTPTEPPMMYEVQLSVSHACRKTKVRKERGRGGGRGGVGQFWRGEGVFVEDGEGEEEGREERGGKGG